MALNLTKEDKELGKSNFNDTTEELTRRGFMKSMTVAGGAVALTGTAAYFGYESLEGKPLKAALIGCGDEGGVLLGEHNPKYIEFIAACDIRPYNKDRIIEGDKKVALRKGFRKIYGDSYANGIRDKHFYTDYREMLQKEKDIEAVVIALPLHLHASVAIECMEAGKHVLCEKLMARTVADCKKMIEVAKKTKRILSIGHQRHYNMLYQQASELLNSRVIGDIKHIRALWHRNFSWNWKQQVDGPELLANQIAPTYQDGWTPPIFKSDYDALNDKLGKIDHHSYGYKDIYELIRWRLYERTGGGLMAELGSHQLDAASIFLGKVHPLAVLGVGTKSFFGDSTNKDDRRGNPREIDDHVFVTFEFPGKNHPKGPNGGGKDKQDVVVVTYSSLSTNGFEPYGETVMGSRGTLIVETEQNAYLYKEPEPGGKGGSPKTTTTTVDTVGAGKTALVSSGTWGGPPPAAAAGAGVGVAVSKGYKEEMEDFAYCVRRWDADKHYYDVDETTKKYKARLPRCHGEVAMADAILALTANMAMAQRQRIEFKEEWFDAKSAETPEKKA